MSPWWSKSSSKDAKRKANGGGGGLFGLIKRKLKCPSDSKQILSQRCSEFPSELGSNSRASVPSALSQNFAERPHTHPHPLPPPENLSDMSRVDTAKRASRNRPSSKGSPSFRFPIPVFNQAQNGHDQTEVDLAKEFFTDSDSVRCDLRLFSPQASNHVTGNHTYTNSPSSGATYISKKKREKLKPFKACVSNQTLPASQKRHPLCRHMASSQIPQTDGFFSAHDSSMPSPSRSPMKVFEPEPALTSDFWAMRPYADTGFLGSGLCSSPGPPLKSCLNRCSCECSPMPSPRMTSPGPSSRLQSGPVTPLHPLAGGSNMGSPARWPDDAITGKQQTHRLPLPPLAISNTGPYSPSYSTKATPMVPKSPGRADLSASNGSRWKKGRILGRGTFGEVHIGFNSETGEMCAMKEVILLSDDASSKESAKQLDQEIALLSHLQHPNIVQYYGSETVDDKLYVYLEYVSGGSIHKLLQEYGVFGELAIRSYTRQILSGLAYLHSINTVHRDIKGANILVNPNGRVKLADFGMAKHISGPSGILSIKGSPHWMAPELVINNTSKGCNLLVDIWSLGITIIEMATTKPLWSQLEAAAVLSEIANCKEVPSLPDHLSLSDDGKDFILQCLQPAPSRRASAAQLLDHPFVKVIPSSPGIGHASEGVSVLDSTGHMPHDILCPVSHRGSPFSPSRTVQNMNRKVPSSPVSSPRTILGLPTPLTEAGGGGAVPFYHQVQKTYTPEFMGFTLTSRSPTRSFSPPSNELHLPAMSRGSPSFQERVPPDDFSGNQKKHRAGKAVLVDHGSQQLLKHYNNQYPLFNIKSTSPEVGRREWR